jgi:hypothetical protein
MNINDETDNMSDIQIPTFLRRQAD